MSPTANAILLAFLVIGTSVWIGGYVTIAVVARAATRTLNQTDRVAFFRSLGRLYFWVGTPAVVLALSTGAVLARHMRADGRWVAAVVVAAVLLASFAIAVVQARRMTRLRQRVLTGPPDGVDAVQVARGARTATALRAMLGALSIILVFLGAFLAAR